MESDPPLPVLSTPLKTAVFAVALLVVGQSCRAESGSGASVGIYDTVWRDLAIFGVLVIVTATFVLAETAMLMVRRTRMEQLAEEKVKSAQIVLRLLKEPTRLLATLQVGLTLVQLFSAGEAASQFVTPLAHWLITTFGDTSFMGRNAYKFAFPTVILMAALITLVVGEISPKSVAIRNAERLSMAFARPVLALQFILCIPVSVVTFFSNLVVRPLGGVPTFHTSVYSEEELKIMVEQSEEHGVIEAEEKEMIHKVFQFADTPVRRVMTPRLDVTAIEADVTIDELIRSVVESGHSRLPVYDDILDNIVGMIHVKDVLRVAAGPSDPVTVRGIMRPAYFVPEHKPVDDLLAEFRSHKTQMAIVRDEYGTVMGVVTIEDLLEEIVGEIQDEYDVEEAITFVTDEDNQSVVVDGMVTISDFNERMGTEIAEDESDTLAGFVFGLMGHQPETGEQVNWGGMEFTVVETDGRRVQKVRIQKIEDSEAQDEAEAEAAEIAATAAENHGAGNGKAE
ncbi:MAG: hemolysin family protein [Chthonomonadales bacterium]